MESYYPIHIRYTVKSTGRLHHQTYCGYCGGDGGYGKFYQRVTKGDKFCRECGNKIDWSQENELSERE